MSAATETSPQESPGKRRLYSVPVGRPFLAAVAEAILSGDLPERGGPPPALLELPDITLLTPTPRAARALRKAFLSAGGGRAMLLPRIRPISESDEELSLINSLADSMAFGTSIAEPAPPIGQTERLLTLTRLVLAWSERMSDAAQDATGDLGWGTASSASPAHGVHLARELARLMDMVETEQKDLGNLAPMVPDTYSEHWKKTLQFLEIVTASWPLVLAERGLTSPAEARNRRILAETRRLEEHPPSGPVIIAGVTGSVPATLELMRVVANLDRGAIVLPALDMALDDASWGEVAHHAEHPQFGLARLLAALGAERGDVAVLAGRQPAPHLGRRNALISEALRPAATTGRWHDFVAGADRGVVIQALAGVSLIEAPGADDEAEVVALILREAAETPGRTAALVSPDRLLARRVAVRLEAWGIRVDDSAGRPLGKTVPGAFLDLVIEVAAQDFAPQALMALLKHPLTRLGLDPFAVRRAARTLEIAAFRAPYIGRGTRGVRSALARAVESRLEGQMTSRAVQRLWDEDLAAAEDLVDRIEAAYAGIVALFDGRERHPLSVLAAAHLAAAEAVALLPLEADGTEPPSELWKGDAGEMAAGVLRGLIDETMATLAIAAADYADVYRSLIAGESVRSRVPLHPRLFIWGPLEARLQQTDVVVLGSLNDGTWPEAADPGPWLNRPMRKALGLPSPEERIGHAAHDFVSQLGAERVYLTRATKIDGVPKVASRWLLRLGALLSSLGLADRLVSAEPWLAWARNRDAAERSRQLQPPAPRPPLALRPRRMSVSGVETWIGNPYAIFARHVLGLEPMPPIGRAPDASIRGAVVHEALARFAAAYPAALPGDVAAELERLFRETLVAYSGHRRVAAFWLPRFERFTHWFASAEPGLRREGGRVIAEVAGKMAVEAPGGPFILTARADRIDIGGGQTVITDYKTGMVPSNGRVVEGMAPQLPLEAAIAVAGGFAGVETGQVAALRYIAATGGEPAGKLQVVNCPDVGALASETLSGLTRLIARFDDESTPYAAVRRAGFRYEYDDFAHLARVGEWSVETAEEA